MTVQQLEKAASPPAMKPPAVVHRSPGGRMAAGTTAKANVPRSSPSLFKTAPMHPDPMARLEEQATSRRPELVPTRYVQMLVFPFHRGAADEALQNAVGVWRVTAEVGL